MSTYETSLHLQASAEKVIKLCESEGMVMLRCTVLYEYSTRKLLCRNFFVSLLQGFKDCRPASIPQLRLRVQELTLTIASRIRTILKPWFFHLMRALPLNIPSRLQGSLLGAQSPRWISSGPLDGIRYASHRPLQGTIDRRHPSRKARPYSLRDDDTVQDTSSGAAPNAAIDSDATPPSDPIAKRREETHPTATARTGNEKDSRITAAAVPSSTCSASLLEELFPHEVIQSRTRLPLLKKLEREVRRIAIEVVVSGLDSDTAATSAKSDNKKATYAKRSTRNQQLTVLVLLKASKYLTEGDFRRLVPGGKHIEGWTNKGDILQVVCGRDRATMAANGVYFLLFATPDAAQSYKNHVSRLHRLSRSYSPTALTIPPPPELDDRGVPTNGSLQTYTLMPPTQDLQLRVVQQPFSPIIRRLIEQTGYDQLIQGRRSEHEVLVSVDGFQPTLYGFRGAVLEDGRERGLQWATHDEHRGFREMWTEPERRSARRGNAEEEVEGAATGEDEGGNKSEDGGGGGERKHRRFIVSFDALDEANRFVMKWHRRDISSLIPDMAPYDRAVANAELIW